MKDSRIVRLSITNHKVVSSTYGRFSGKYSRIYAEQPDETLDFPPYAFHTYVFGIPAKVWDS